ncbi:MAG: 50S ribosomal protein L2 [Thermoplasmatota archaeon]
MGKRIITQRRGKGSVHVSPGHRHLGPVKYPNVRGEVSGKVLDVVHSPGHSAPVVDVQLETGERRLFLATEGIHVGKEIHIGGEAISEGNIVPLRTIPEGTLIYNVEARPGDGGKFVRSGGTAALLVAREAGRVTIRLPSGAFKTFNPNCRATVGVVAGGGRGDKPLAKAGKAFHAWRSRARLWPRVRGVAKNPVDHPHGGGNAHRKEGKPTTVSRNTPPGRKVGHVAARRTGLRKG